MRKENNTVWDISTEDGSKVTSFHEIVAERVRYFQNLCKYLRRINIVEIVNFVSKFPRFGDEDQNEHLMELVSREELKEVLSSF